MADVILKCFWSVVLADNLHLGHHITEVFTGALYAKVMTQIALAWLSYSILRKISDKDEE